VKYDGRCTEDVGNLEEACDGVLLEVADIVFVVGEALEDVL
jgi:hypothetical protein